MRNTTSKTSGNSLKSCFKLTEKIGIFKNIKIITIGMSMPKDGRIKNLLIITIGEVLAKGKNMTFSKNNMCFQIFKT
jgi:hypothetical protein